jgi:hypothetical protein
MTKTKLNLLDNGLDYVYEAVKPMSVAHDHSRHSWKYSVLHLYSGIELLLKEKLKREHWSLIFQDVSSANPQNLENGDFISVYHDELAKRLRDIANVTIDDKPIKKLRDLRNRFEHFEANIALDECQELISAALDEIIKFYENNLSKVSTDEQLEKFNVIKSIATRFEVYRKQRLRKFKEAIRGITVANSGVIVFCPDCDSLSFAVFKDTGKACKCFVCDKEYKKDDYLKTIREHEEYLSEESLFSDSYESYDTLCPFCREETRVRYYDSNYATLFYCCLNCLNREEPSIEEKADIDFEVWLESLEKARTVEETLRLLRERLTPKEIVDIFRESKESKAKSGED